MLYVLILFSSNLLTSHYLMPDVGKQRDHVYVQISIALAQLAALLVRMKSTSEEDCEHENQQLSHLHCI